MDAARLGRGRRLVFIAGKLEVICLGFGSGRRPLEAILWVIMVLHSGCIQKKELRIGDAAVDVAVVVFVVEVGVEASRTVSVQ